MVLLQRQDKLGQVIDLLLRQITAGSPQAVPALEQQVLNRGIPSVVQIGGGPPDLDEGGSVETLAAAKGIWQSEIMCFQVGVQRRRVAAAAGDAAAFKELPAAFGRGAQTAAGQVRTGRGLERFQIVVDSGRLFFGAIGEQDVRQAARTADSADSRTLAAMEGGVWWAYSMLFVFLGLPVPSFIKSQFRPSTRPSGWQLAAGFASARSRWSRRETTFRRGVLESESAAAPRGWIQRRRRPRPAGQPRRRSR